MAQAKQGENQAAAQPEEEEDKISQFTDEGKKLMTFEYFLETSKIIYEANFYNQRLIV